MAHLQAFAHAHWRAILYVLGAWIAAGNAVAKKWPIPPATAPKWKRALHFVAVNIPAIGRALQGRTIWGFTFAIPLLSFTLRDDSPAQTGGDHAPPPGGQSGRASVTVLLWLALVTGLCGVALASSGCASLEKTTMQTEFTLSAANSMCFHLLDSVDADVTDKIRVKNLNGDRDGALQDYADYKPKIEKARNVCNGADDTVQNADKERKAIPKGGDAKNFTAWLPALSASIPLVEQAIADIKAMVVK